MGLNVQLLFLGIVLLFSNSTQAAGTITGDIERQPLNWSAISMFLVFVFATLIISYWASKLTRTSGEFYTAGGQLTGLQNGAAIAGDFMSAASFLGITGLMFVGGFDGLIFGIGAFVGWPVMLFLLAERVRNLGRYNFADVVSLRLEKTSTRIISVFGGIVVVIMALIGQMVGAGKLIELLFGLPYETAVIVVSVLVIAYVSFGGMLATTWVQIVKAILLMFGATVMALLIFINVGFDLNILLEGASSNHPLGEKILRPGILFNDPIQIATIMVSMLFGTLGLPHIIMRLFTVPTAQEAGKSAFYASTFIGYFFLLMILIGFGTSYFLIGNTEYFGVDAKLIGGNNMAAIHLSNALGGDLLAGFMSAVAFATILAVVAGLTVAASAAVSHDLYAQVVCKGKPDPKEELKITRLTTVVVGLIAVSLGILFQHQNIAFITAMPMVVAASVNFPVLFMSLYWEGMTTRGAIMGAMVGLALSLGLTIIGPQVWVATLGFEKALFPYNYPTLFTMPLAFLAIWFFSITDQSERAAADRDNYYSLLKKAEFGN